MLQYAVTISIPLLALNIFASRRSRMYHKRGWQMNLVVDKRQLNLTKRNIITKNPLIFLDCPLDEHVVS